VFQIPHHLPQAKPNTLSKKKNILEERSGKERKTTTISLNSSNEGNEHF
jgi:hypothetical protein